MEGFRELARNIGKVIDVTVDKNSIEKAAEIIGRLRAISETESTSEHRKIIDNVIDGAGSKDNIKKLFAGDKKPAMFRHTCFFLIKCNTTAFKSFR